MKEKTFYTNNFYVSLTDDYNFLQLEEFFYNDNKIYGGQTKTLHSNLFKKVCPYNKNGYYNFHTGEYNKSLTDSFFTLVQKYKYIFIMSND